MTTFLLYCAVRMAVDANGPAKPPSLCNQSNHTLDLKGVRPLSLSRIYRVKAGRVHAAQTYAGVAVLACIQATLVFVLADGFVNGY